MRRRLWVGGLFIEREAARPLILVVCAVALLAGLPRLAAHFREPEHYSSGEGAQSAPIERTADGDKTHPLTIDAVTKPAGRVVPTKPALPKDAELILAIQQELARIGLYGGPITPQWTEGVLSAARRFSNSSQPQPSRQLLAALRAAQPKIAAKHAREKDTINLQAAQDLINGMIPASPADRPVEGLVSEGYLPPWEALREKSARLGQSQPPGASAGSALTLGIAARSSRRPERASRRRFYTSVRRRGRILYYSNSGRYRY